VLQRKRCIPLRGSTLFDEPARADARLIRKLPPPNFPVGGLAKVRQLNVEVA